MSTEQRNNGNTTPPSTPHGDKDKNPETEEREEEVTEEERKQQKLEALMRILDVEEKKANEKLERICHERKRVGALSQDIKAHCLDDDGEAELADLLCGSSLQRSEVADETDDESTSDEDVYQAQPEKDGGRKRRRAEKKREKKGKGKQLGRPEKRRKTEKAQPETEDPEVRRLDAADAWVEGETSCQLCTQSGIQCLLPASHIRKRACRNCRLRKVKCSNLPENEHRQPTVRRRVPEATQTAPGPSRLGGRSLPEVRGVSPVRRDTRHTLMQRDVDLLTSRADETDRRLENNQAILRQLALRVLRQDPEIAWARQYLHRLGENTDGESESSSSEEEEETEETKRVRTWAKKVGASEKEENPQSENGDGGSDGDGDVEMEVPSMEVVPPTGTVDGPPMFGPFATTSDGTVFHVNMESTMVVVKTEEEESGIPRGNEEDLARRGQLRKKNKLNAKAKAKEAENATEEGAEAVVKTEEQETQVPVTVQPPAPHVVQAPGVFFETATSTGKLFPVQVEMIEVLDSDDEAPAP
ncbi:hypothetical protein C8R45DRAFT_1111920 [Mycena sanguinolenta]|nr:hypothetical protein C8R45DRAFT_1111920 [Mycena sanguinolenta]